MIAQQQMQQIVIVRKQTSITQVSFQLDLFTVQYYTAPLYSVYAA